MYLTDKKILARGEALISPFDAQKVQAVCYDLTADVFYNEDGTEHRQYEVMPNGSVFVQCREWITLPNSLCAVVTLRNGRIRQGFSLDAPLYHPGHKTPVYFRVTNVSNSKIQLSAGDSLASILFEDLGEEVQKPYSGTFQNEDRFKGMGDYTTAFSSGMETISEKLDNVKEIEKSIYGNVLSIMAIFVAVFSIINVNLTLVQSTTNLKALLTFNLSTVGSVCILVGAISTIIPNAKNRRILWGVGAVLFFCAVVLQFILL